MRNGLYSKYARGRTREILDGIAGHDVSDASDEIRLAIAALASVVERDAPLDAETADAVSVAANRLALSKQRQRKLDSLLTRTEFGDYIARLLVVVRAFVPSDKWKDCEADIARVPVLLDGGTDP